MRKEIATEIYGLAMNAVTNLTLILNTLQENSTSEEFMIFKRGVGTAIGDIQIDLIEKITTQYPELNDLEN